MQAANALQFWLLSLAAFTISFALSFLFVRFHKMHAIASRADKRRHNEQPIPQIGGAAIVGGFLGGSALYWYLGGMPEAGLWRTSFLMGAVAVALIIGILDDAHELRARWKLLGQNLVALFLLLAIEGIQTPPDRLFGQGSTVAFALKWFWCLGILNSINLIDGLDELASGVGMIVLLFVTTVGSDEAVFRTPLLYVALPAMVGFYFWNRHPAKIYLGESGAQMVAIFLFLGSMTFHSSPSAGVDSIALFFALGVPILDTLLAILRRVKRRTGLMVADREHLHHRLGRLGLSHPNISRFLHLLTLYLCGIGYAYGRFSVFNAQALALALTGVGINLFLLRQAESKLYSYLANFASHMLTVLDATVQDSKSLVTRQKSLNSSGTPYVMFQLDLSHCVGNLLEKSPGRIQSFYGKLGHALRGMEDLREVHFESSRMAVVLQRLRPGESVTWAEASLRTDLSQFEIHEKIDLGLHLSESIKTTARNSHEQVAVA